MQPIQTMVSLRKAPIRYALVIAVALSMVDAAHAGLIAQWQFNAGEELVDSQGNFGNLILEGDATIAGGALNVNGQWDRFHWLVSNRKHLHRPNNYQKNAHLMAYPGEL